MSTSETPIESVYKDLKLALRILDSLAKSGKLIYSDPEYATYRELKMRNNEKR